MTIMVIHWTNGSCDDQRKCIVEGTDHDAIKHADSVLPWTAGPIVFVPLVDNEYPWESAYDATDMVWEYHLTRRGGYI